MTGNILRPFLVTIISLVSDENFDQRSSSSRRTWNFDKFLNFLSFFYDLSTLTLICSCSMLWISSILISPWFIALICFSCRFFKKSIFGVFFLNLHTCLLKISINWCKTRYLSSLDILQRLLEAQLLWR